jgi:cytochrome c nitrite reductase small subunit
LSPFWNHQLALVIGMFIKISLFSTIIAGIIGVMIGVVGYAISYADAFAYFSSDSKNCANCHIMNDQYASWQKSGHHHVATCNDCHIPHDLVGKYVAKAENGYHHSKAFTLQDFHEPIMIKKKNAEILQVNCVKCHENLIESIVHSNKKGDSDVSCVHCHRDVGHGPYK